MNSSIEQKWEGGPNVHHWGAQLILVYMLVDFFSFLQGPRPPPPPKGQRGSAPEDVPLQYRHFKLQF